MHARIDRRATASAEPIGAPRAWRLWIFVATGVAVVLCVLLLHAQWEAVLRPCAPPRCWPPQLTASAMDSLADLGLTPRAWATLTLTTSGVLVAASLFLVLLVARRGSGPAARTMPLVLLPLSLAPVWGFAFSPWAAELLNGASTLSFFLMIGLFPDGRFRPRWTAVPVVIAAVWVVVTRIPPVSDAVARGADPWSVLYGLVFALATGGVVVCQVVRYRRGTPADRRALALLGLVLLLFTAPGAAFAVYQGVESETAGIGTLAGSGAYLSSNLFIVVVYAVIAVAAVRDGAYGVRLTLNRVVAGLLGLGIAVTGYAAAAAVAAVLLTGRLLGGWLPQALGSAVAALALFLVFRPIARWIDRLVYGDADDPDRLAARLAAVLAAAPDSRTVIPELLDALAERLQLPWVALDAPADAGSGTSGGDAEESGGVPVELDPGRPGAAVLTVGLRAGQRRLHRRDRAAVRAAAPTLLSGLAAVRLTDELQASRRRVVSAAEGERRALRRELHDGLGPTLAAVRHRVAAARADSSDTDPGSHLGRAEQQLTESVETIRTLARRLRPPALDEHGLARALEETANDLGLDAAVSVTPEPLPDLLEVALYRIAVEALANTARHAAADQATVRVAVHGSDVVLEVTDDGVGIGGRASGVGIASMRERAAELGGHLTVTDAAGGGTLVSARLPVTSGETG
ncbi:Histidine kinase-, DNA gyrase B-, and HSP90-like ATPase [Quadrisphaera granulorum]|uniref:histidine kinase n=1 Tax=Quadrisphaera granulorum TaxID=317664 RepID=A0A316A697_9ACTN|nr:ATP-binding protein [Quadrisphaera granulorum]PWJ53039.1 histidine kinase/DNA gyrase B/HSP90-like ATPase [Quadrisphaera granulorum]SZE97204.1 Histidine kinase-, DNA gyrase B-, and HSP90-like ATPase [Quadrisphaera granulorum]